MAEPHRWNKSELDIIQDAFQTGKKPKAVAELLPHIAPATVKNKYQSLKKVGKFTKEKRAEKVTSVVAQLRSSPLVAVTSTPLVSSVPVSVPVPIPVPVLAPVPIPVSVPVPVQIPGPTELTPANVSTPCIQDLGDFGCDSEDDGVESNTFKIVTPAPHPLNRQFTYNTYNDGELDYITETFKATSNNDIQTVELCNTNKLHSMAWRFSVEPYYYVVLRRANLKYSFKPFSKMIRGEPRNFLEVTEVLPIPFKEVDSLARICGQLPGIFSHQINRGIQMRFGITKQRKFAKRPCLSPGWTMDFVDIFHNK